MTTPSSGFLDDPTSPSSAPSPGNPYDVGGMPESGFLTTQTPFQSGVKAILGSKAGKATLGVLTTAGKALQPFAAPQQIIFGGLGAIEDLAHGNTQAAADTWKRGLGAAGDYLTYGLTARKGVGNGVDDREKRVSGFELAKGLGMGDGAAKTVGLAADFFLDVPLIGYIGKATKATRGLDITSDVAHLAGANMAYSFTKDANGALDLTGIKKFATRVIAAPFSTAPIHDIATGIPQYYRQRVSETAAMIIEDGVKATSPMTGKQYTILGGRANAKFRGADAPRTDQLGSTVAQLIISKYGGVRGVQRMEGSAIQNLKDGKITGTGISQRLEDEIYVTTSEAATISARASQAENKYKSLLTPLNTQARDEFNKIAYSMLDWKEVGDFHAGLANLDAFSRRIGNPGFKQQALDTLWESAALDTYMGLLRHKVGAMDEASTYGVHEGLRQFETVAFGQPKSVNPLAASVQGKAAAATKAGLAPSLPDPFLHFRRAFTLNFQPEDLINQVKAQNLPGMLHQIDETKLTSAFQGMIVDRATKMGANPQTLANTAAGMKASATQMAQDLAATFKGKNVDERTATMATLAKYGYGQPELKTMLDSIGDQWFQKSGIAYRPPAPDVAEKLRYLSERGTVGTAGSSVAAGTNRAVLSSRQDIPDWMVEAMGHNLDIADLLKQGASINQKLYTNRNIVQQTYDFLHSEGAVMSNAELNALPNGAHNNWRRVTPDLAARLKGTNNGSGPFGDIPFKGDEYIPAAYHDLLVGASSVQDAQVLHAGLSYLMTAWKGHKVGNAASIVRDTMTNYRFASDWGISPHALTRAVSAGIGLRNQAVEGGMLGALRGRAPDVLDQKAFINYRGTKITFKEILDQGGLLHGSFLVNELNEPFRALRDNLASAKGDGLQGVTAAILDHSDAVRKALDSSAANGNIAAKVAGPAGKLAAGVVDAATGLGGPITKMLQDFKGQVDVIYKLGIYIHKRSEGLQPHEAAKYSDELLFNYNNQPIMVDYLRRNGISPFAAFQFMSTGRMMRTLYENPYAVERWYRLPQSATAGDARTTGETQYTAPDYMRRQLWIPLFNPLNTKSADNTRDSQGRTNFLNLSSIMPESSVFNMTASDAVSQWVPPYIDLYQSIMTGQGYQGMPIYKGGKSLAETWQSGNKDAVYQGIVKAMHQYGATPYAPGSPQADRLARALVTAHVPADQIMHNPEVQAFLNVGANGVFGAPLQRDAIAPVKLGGAAPQDVPYALARTVGFTSAPVTGFAGKPGSAVGTLQGLKYNISDLRSQMVSDIKAAGADPESVKKIVARYMPLIAQQTARIDNARAFMERYKQTYQGETQQQR